ncbi:MAG TPA: DUF6807 family protein [Chthonomonadales bacterium]|nr:DUF6807 family protein [Chthonomonadales bacterium]
MRIWLAGAAAALACALAAAGAPGAAGALDVEATPDTVRVRQAGALVLAYRRTGVPAKPYVVELRSPAGVNVLRDNVADHLHHHGLMFAVTAGGVNFWEETPGSGTQTSLRTRPLRAGLLDSLEWRAPSAPAPMMLEERRIEILRSPDPRATLIAWRSDLTLPRGAGDPLRLDGAHYNGLGMRFVAEMDGGTFANADEDPGVVFRGEERLMRGRWCAYRATVGGRPVTVAMFDHPANPRPATWFTMPRPFGYLSATLRYHEEPVELRPGQRLTLRYGVAVWDGDAAPERIESVGRAWLRQAGGGGR